MERIQRYRDSILGELHSAFQEDYTQKQTSMSFAFGVFVCSLPTLGTGLILFALISKIFEAINRVALFASLLILNPFVKPLYYIGSISLGALIFTGSLRVGADPSSVLLYLIVGNLIIGVLSAVVAYYAANLILSRYESEVEEVREDVIGKLEEDLEKKGNA